MQCLNSVPSTKNYCPCKICNFFSKGKVRKLRNYWNVDLFHKILIRLSFTENCLHAKNYNNGLSIYIYISIFYTILCRKYYFHFHSIDENILFKNVNYMC